MTDIKNLRLSLNDLCWLLDLTKQRISQLEDDGVIERLDRNSYSLKSVPRYLKLLRQAGAGPEKLQDAKLELLLEKVHAAKTDREEREATLLPARDVLNWNVKFCTVVKLHLMSLPSRLAPRLVNVRDTGKAETMLRSAITESLQELQQLLRPCGIEADRIAVAESKVDEAIHETIKHHS
jgi:hypothetical protein